MDIRQIRYFVTIVNEGQITLAAKKLNMAQPPLSQQLKNLEEELGTKLIVRNGRKMELTEAGKILYKKGTQLLHKFEETVMEVRETGGGVRGTLAIGIAKSCLSYLPPRIRHFKERFPNITFKIWEGDPYRLSEHLVNRNIELAIIRIPVHLEHFNKISLGKEPFVLVIPKEWKFAEQTRISLKTIANIPLLVLRRINGKGAYEMVINAFKAQGLEPNIIGESPDANILLSLVEAGVGATLLPQAAVSVYPKTNIKVLNIKDCFLSTETSVIWLKDAYLSRIAKQFIETFINE